MKRSKPFYILGILAISIVFMIGAFFGVSGFIKRSKENLEDNIWQSFLDSFDWETFPWETFPFDEFSDFPWEELPWEDIPLENLPEDFPWDRVPVENIPWDNLPDDFDWSKVPWDNLPENFDWNKVPWDNLPENFDWNNVPWGDMPEDFDWNNVPWEDIPGDFDWNNVPMDKLPEDFDWNNVPTDKLPEDFDWNNMNWDDMPEDFDWNSVPWEDMPEDFDWSSVPWKDMPEDFDWSRIPWADLPPDFPWQDIPWENMPEDFWQTFPWEDLPEGFPWFVLPWLLISPGVVPDGVLPDGFYPDAWDCEHEFITDWVVTESPTCTNPGKKQNFCTKCKQLITEEVGLTKHTFGLDSICSVCHIRRLYFRSENLTKQYDGAPLSGTVENITFVRALSALEEGDRVDLSAIEDKITFNSLNTVGVAPNGFSFGGGIPVTSGNSGDGGPVSGWGDKYYLAFEFGTLEMTAREITIITPDLSKPFDGVPLVGTEEGVIVEGLAEGDVCRVTFGEGLSDIGRKPNDIVSYRILNSKGEDVTSCYKVKTRYGKLTITP